VAGVNKAAVDADGVWCAGPVNVQFETMRKSDQVREFRCFYHPEERKFYSVVMLG
jgi:hypothetical protein